MWYAAFIMHCGACIWELEAYSSGVEASRTRQRYHKPRLCMGNMEAMAM